MCVIVPYFNILNTFNPQHTHARTHTLPPLMIIQTTDGGVDQWVSSARGIHENLDILKSMSFICMCVCVCV